MSQEKPKQVDSFSLIPGRVLAGKYEIISLLGAGWEGEVYRVKERGTNIERAAKLFFPHRNIQDKTSNVYANKLYKLRDCPILIQYHTQDSIRILGHTVRVLISEYVEGPLLSEYIRAQKGKVLSLFQAVHLLHALASGLECVHSFGEHHGDLHSDNIIVRRLGLSFDLKVMDLLHQGRSARLNRFNDLCDLIRIFYDAIGGAARYNKQPREVKDICCGLKRSLILKKFRTVSGLKVYLENQSWGN